MEAIIAANVLIFGGVGAVAYMTAEQAPGFDNVVQTVKESPANPRVLFDSEPTHW
eukprot:CAMPEP_0184311978 /NCGR_PEP_ID=MMETSP1049-20130417/46207_1 /TAXON_ID=77928 /ORGANISM="Proteomonas sulcata, Strain CCMP704" /LENGTH=54 /DNA_ID=CAMNT_0026627789 /DNA_START=201 /DNA_END=362 /DNA_ORIENTATION=-